MNIHINKLLKIITSRRFIGFTSFMVLFFIVTLKMLNIENPAPLMPLWSAFNTSMVLVFAAFLGNSSYSKYLDVKGRD